jgi:uncharacterized protein (DUF2267 family)/CBS domain-containing protein
MKVKDVMTKEVKTCSPKTDLATAAESMWMRDCGVLPIVDQRGQVVGMITDRDICIATGCRRCDPATILVREIMAGQVHSCSPEADLRDALQIMQQKQVRRLPVIDFAGKLCGILSMNDVALKVQPDAKAPELGAREIHATLKSICAQRGDLQETTQMHQLAARSTQRNGRPHETNRPKIWQMKESIMNTHQPEVFETTLQKTNTWLKEISDLLHWDDHQKAYHGLRAVLHVLRDRLPVEEAAHLGAQLPMLVRGFYYDCWKPAHTPGKIKTTQEFYDAVRENFTADRNVNPMRLTEAVMTVLCASISGSEVEKLRGIFPPALRPLWPEVRTIPD